MTSFGIAKKNAGKTTTTAKVAWVTEEVSASGNARF